MGKILGTNKIKINCKSKKSIPEITYWKSRNGLVSIEDMDTKWIKNALTLLKRFKGNKPRLIYNYTSDWQYIKIFEKTLSKRKTQCVKNEKQLKK